MPKAIYVIAPINTERRCKIGISTDPQRRCRQLQTGSAEPLQVFHVEILDHGVPAMAMERLIHKTLGHMRLAGEWFALPPQDAVATVQWAAFRFSGGLAGES